MLRVEDRIKTRLIDPLFVTGPRFWLVTAGLLAVVAWGGVIYVRQLLYGLGETGMSRPSFWGIYIVNFIFLIGLSMAGTLISASLQLLGVEWRRPLIRIAETLTVIGLLMAGLQIVVDMGRPDRMIFMLPYGRLQSPLLWDALSLSIYILASMMALFLDLLPDIAILRDNLPPACPAWRQRLYTWLALGWRGNRTQWARLHRVMTVMAIAIIPAGISLHTVTSWIFSTTVQPGWKSTILGPYFVVGAIFSGTGLLLIVMSLVRKLLPVEGFLDERPYRQLNWVFIIMNLIWFYFTYTETLTIATEQETQEFPVLASKLWGGFAPGFWAMVVLMLAAFWITVMPRLVRSGPRRALIFQPRFALAMYGGALVAAFLLLRPFYIPGLEAGKFGVFSQAYATLFTPQSRTLNWALLGLLLIAGSLGFGPWLKARPAFASVLAGACVVVGMWLERWNIIVPTMTHPRLIPFATYHPGLTEWSLTAATAALFILAFLVFFKLFPVVSIWEVVEGEVIEKAYSGVAIPPPEPVERVPVSGWEAK